MSQNSLQHGNELTPVIPGFILVIPAKAGIHTDSPPEPYCPVPPGLFIPEKAEIHRWRWIPAFAGMTTSEHGNELLEFWVEFCDILDWARVYDDFANQLVSHILDGGFFHPSAFQLWLRSYGYAPVIVP
ncbi:hypothetical protein [Endozoicomonas sp. 8E]|uniref:hypothetical protein n=1 Tax=Endozoicomonas sp. 8E TaxID=3035692 RepID=UPI00293942A3|nr:hypothetical protein [Endozoicomonas sp. 8E]WOG25642.1 hypothetical protein P6910_13730 [Endozoicomonas sp. 8E]